MWYLLLFWTLTSEMISADLWDRNKTFVTMEECVTRKIPYKQRMDWAWKQDGSHTKTHMTFECRLGPEMLAQS